MGVKVTGVIEPVSLSDTYPVIDPLYGIDGLRCVDTVDDMYNIPLERRRGGMVVGIPNTFNQTVTYYKLKPGITWTVGTLSVTDWDPFFGSGTGSTAISNKFNIADETIIVPTNYMYLVYGDLTVGTAGVFENYGRTVIINGDLKLVGDGTYSNSGDLQIVTLTQTNKFGYSFSLGPGTALNVSHGLNTSDIVYTVRDGNNFVYPNIELVDDNNLTLTTTGTISNGRINIMS
jgi:hypothetical protein